jgi:hypothetical protein
MSYHTIQQSIRDIQNQPTLDWRSEYEQLRMAAQNVVDASDLSLALTSSINDLRDCLNTVDPIAHSICTRRPSKIMFAGIDESVTPWQLAELAAEYPGRIGFAITVKPRDNLFESVPRYPSVQYVRSLSMVSGVRFDLHLCGAWVDALMAGVPVDWPRACPFLEILNYTGIQINFGRRQVYFNKATSCKVFDLIANCELIVQANPATVDIVKDIDALWIASGRPRENRPTILLDNSCGDGKVPTEWVKASDYPLANTVGYAGGIDPNNVRRFLPKIAAAAGNTTYYLDIQSGVRSGTTFSIDKAREVCRKVFGPTTK